MYDCRWFLVYPNMKYPWTVLTPVVSQITVALYSKKFFLRYNLFATKLYMCIHCTWCAWPMIWRLHLRIPGHIFDYAMLMLSHHRLLTFSQFGASASILRCHVMLQLNLNHTSYKNFCPMLSEWLQFCHKKSSRRSIVGKDKEHILYQSYPGKIICWYSHACLWGLEIRTISLKLPSGLTKPHMNTKSYCMGRNTGGVKMKIYNILKIYRSTKSIKPSKVYSCFWWWWWKSCIHKKVIQDNIRTS